MIPATAAPVAAPAAGTGKRVWIIEADDTHTPGELINAASVCPARAGSSATVTTPACCGGGATSSTTPRASASADRKRRRPPTSLL